MKTVRFLAVISVVATATLGSAAAPQDSRKPDADRFVALFDGKSLEGWEGNATLWSAKDGMLVGDSPGISANEFLCTRREYGDFELRLEFRLRDGVGNSGVQFRTKRLPNTTEVSGYQADIGQGYWGCLYDESRRKRVLAQAPEAGLAKVLKKADWNSYVIRAKGKQITMQLNGLTTVNFIETDAGIDVRGIIAVQIHSGGPMRIEFRNLRIREE